MKFYFFAALLGSTTLFAAGKTQHKHNHEEAELNIAVQGNTATIELESPAVIIYGFEYQAKKPGDIKRRDDGIKTLETRISEIVKFDSKLNCKFTKHKIEPFVTEGEDDHDHDAKHHAKDKKDHKHAEHGEVHASFGVTCDKPLAGTKLTFGAKKVFPKVSRLDVQVVGDKQSGAEIENDKGSVDL